MPRRLEPLVPAPLAALLGGHDLAAAIGLTLLLLTTSEDGWPHVAMLSAGEVLVPEQEELRLALWSGTHTTANLTRSGRATLMAVLPPATYHLRLKAGAPLETQVSGHPRAIFRTSVEEALEDVVAYAAVTSGIQFKLIDREATLKSWQANLEAMRT